MPEGLIAFDQQGYHFAFLQPFDTFANRLSDETAPFSGAGDPVQRYHQRMWQCDVEAKGAMVHFDLVRFGF
jgi:hypothetical protein